MRRRTVRLIEVVDKMLEEHDVQLQQINDMADELLRLATEKREADA